MSMSMAERLGMKRSARGVRRRLAEAADLDLGVFCVRDGFCEGVCGRLAACEASRALRCQRGSGALRTGAAKLEKSSSEDSISAEDMADSERGPGRLSEKRREREEREKQKQKVRRGKRVGGGREKGRVGMLERKEA